MIPEAIRKGRFEACKPVSLRLKAVWRVQNGLRTRGRGIIALACAVASLTAFSQDKGGAPAEPRMPSTVSVPAKGTGTVTGKVMDINNKPLKTGNIAIVPCKYPPDPVAAGVARPKPPLQIARGASADDGTFKLENVPVGGPYHIAVHVPPKDLAPGQTGSSPGHSKNFEVKANETVDAGTITVKFR